MVFNGRWVAETTGAMLMREAGHTPVHDFPREDVRMELFESSDTRSVCPYKGNAV